MKIGERIKLIGLTIQNVYRIRAAELEFDPEVGLYEITGKCRQGKTSILRIIRGLIMGAKAVSQNARNDEAEPREKSFSEGKFSNGFQINRRHTNSNPKGVLLVEGPDGGEYKQGDIDRWSGNGAADILALRPIALKQPEKFTELLLGLSRDRELPAKLKGIRTERQTIKDERSPFVSEKQRAERTKKPEGDRPEAIDVSEAMAELAALESGQKRKDEAIEAFKKADERANTANLAIAQRKLEVEKAEESLRIAKSSLGNAENFYDEVCTERSNAAVIRDQTPDLSEDIAAVRERIGDVDARNAALEPWKAYDRAQEVIEKNRDEIQLRNKRIDELNAAEKALLTDSGIEIKGLSFSEDGDPLLWNRTFDLASGREWVEFAAEVSYAKEDDLGFFLIDEANDLDIEGMYALRETSEKYGVTAIVCRIEPSGAGEIIVVEDGKAWNKKPEPEAEV